MTDTPQESVGGLDMHDLERKLDDSLDRETPGRLKKWLDGKRETEKVADECFDIYLNEKGIRKKERRLILSHENKRVKEANRKQRNLCAEEWNSKHGYKFSDSYDETVMSEIRNAPEPL